MPSDKIRSAVDYLEVAAEVGASDDNHQSAFLNAFFEELKKDCGTHYAKEMQLHMIRDKLSDVSVESLKVLLTKELHPDA